MKIVPGNWEIDEMHMPAVMPAKVTVADLIGSANGDGGSVLMDIASSLRRIADHVDPPPQGPVTNGVVPQAGRRRPKRESPYMDAQEAADYLGITAKSLYGQVERRHIIPLRGPRRQYRFTTDMLDEYLRRNGRQR